MASEDIRWQQRFENFGRALSHLSDAVTLAKSRPLSDLEKQGVIQAFEFTHELAWKTLKDFLQARGTTDPIYGSRDATRQAFAAGLITEGEVWMEMILDRNRSPHAYDADTAESIYLSVIERYHSLFISLSGKLGELVV